MKQVTKILLIVIVMLFLSAISITAENAEIIDGNNGIRLRFYNVEKGNLEHRLTGAEFQVTKEDRDGNVVIVEVKEERVIVNGEKFTGKLKDLTTDKNGLLQIEGLTPGKYYLFETKAPIDPKTEKPYALLSLPVEVYIDHHAKEMDVFVENSKEGWNFHLNGNIFFAVGVVLMIGAFIALRRHKK